LKAVNLLPLQQDYRVYAKEFLIKYSEEFNFNISESFSHIESNRVEQEKEAQERQQKRLEQQIAHQVELEQKAAFNAQLSNAVSQSTDAGLQVAMSALGALWRDQKIPGVPPSFEALRGYVHLQNIRKNQNPDNIQNEYAPAGPSTSKSLGQQGDRLSLPSISGEPLVDDQ
jgi:hypothetical protein